MKIRFVFLFLSICAFAHGSRMESREQLDRVGLYVLSHSIDPDDIVPGTKKCWNCFATNSIRADKCWKCGKPI